MRKIKLIPNKIRRAGFVPIMLIDVEWNEKVKSYAANIMFSENPDKESNRRLGAKLYGENEETMEQMIINAAKICSVTHEMTVFVPDKVSEQ